MFILFYLDFLEVTLFWLLSLMILYLMCSLNFLGVFNSIVEFSLMRVEVGSYSENKPTDLLIFMYLRWKKLLMQFGTTHKFTDELFLNLGSGS